MAPRREHRSWILGVVMELDALGSAAMPALLLAAVPLLVTVNISVDLFGAVVIGFAVLLGAMGAVTAWILGKAIVRGNIEFPDHGWFLLRPLSRNRSAPELSQPSYLAEELYRVPGR